MSYWQKLSRREALTRMAALAAGLSVNATANSADEIKASAWSTDLPAVDAPGYGTDPILSNPEDSPWPRLLSRSQLDVLASLAEFFCPGSIDAGVVDVLNEWLSAPYPDQSQDRQVVVPGFGWLDAEMARQHGNSFATASLPQQINFLEPYIELIDRDSTNTPPLKFLSRVRILITGAYFSSPQGASELGYVGNQPIAGDYPGPSKEAWAHLNDLLEELDLQ